MIYNKYVATEDGRYELRAFEGKTLAQIHALVAVGKPLAAVRQFVRLYLEAQYPYSDICKRHADALGAGDVDTAIGIEVGRGLQYITPTEDDVGGWQLVDGAEDAYPWLAGYRDVEGTPDEPESVVTEQDIDTFLMTNEILAADPTEIWDRLTSGEQAAMAAHPNPVVQALVATFSQYKIVRFASAKYVAGLDFIDSLNDPSLPDTAKLRSYKYQP